jgi:poly(3-hydroxybutyrate) depolymerase
MIPNSPVALWVLLSVVRLAFAQIPSDPGCNKRIPSDATLGESQLVKIKSGKLDRHYLLHVPETYNGKKSVPLILSFHGLGKDAKYQQKLTGFSKTSFNPNAITVYPQGVIVSHRFILSRKWVEREQG